MAQGVASYKPYTRILISILSLFIVWASCSKPHTFTLLFFHFLFPTSVTYVEFEVLVDYVCVEVRHAHANDTGNFSVLGDI